MDSWKGSRTLLVFFAVVAALAVLFGARATAKAMTSEDVAQNPVE